MKVQATIVANRVPFIVNCFKYYDKLSHKWRHYNSTSEEDARRYRKKLMEDTGRYDQISGIYERDISKPCLY